RYVKDAFHEYLIGRREDAVNPANTGTKAAAIYRLDVPAGGSATLRLRLTDSDQIAAASPAESLGKPFEDAFAARIAEADEFYAQAAASGSNDDGMRVQRQAFAGLLWSKQFYHYDVKAWLEGDPTQPPPPPERKYGRNHKWTHLYNADVIAMPDKW